MKFMTHTDQLLLRVAVDRERRRKEGKAGDPSVRVSCDDLDALLDTALMEIKLARLINWIADNMQHERFEHMTPRLIASTIRERHNKAILGEEFLKEV